MYGYIYLSVYMVYALNVDTFLLYIYVNIHIFIYATTKFK